ncbi:hypothetical protein N9522_07420 [Candidatus Thioglobus sp.]|nr:hypothetical protein [Candidatus Thioglobus sp.]
MTTVVEALTKIQKSDQEVSPTAFNITEATIHHGSGFEYPIGNLVYAVNFFEDIETVGVTGWLDMYDNVNLIQGGPIIGHELLYLRFETAGATEAGVPEFAVDYTKHPLMLYKIEELVAGAIEGRNSNWLEYRLHFCSTEMLRNDRIRLSRTYQGVVSDIVTDVLKNHLETTKPLDIQETLDLHHFIAPSIRPYHLISDLVSKAQSMPLMKGGRHGHGMASSTIFKGRHSDFLFYETAIREDDSGGFKFKPALSQADKPSLSFTCQSSPAAVSDQGDPPPNPAEVGYQAVMLRSLNYEFVDLGNKYDTIPGGGWSGKHIRHNGVTKSYAISESNYLKSLLNEKYSYVSKTPTYNSPRSVTEWPDSHVRFTSSSAQTDSNINKVNKRVDYPWRIMAPSASLNRIMQLNHLLGMQRIEMTLPGLSGLSVGELAYADLPDLGLAGNQPGLEGAKDVWENRLDNIWLVTKVSHRLTTGGENPQYLTRIELANTMSSTGMVLPDYFQFGRTSPQASIFT